MTRPVPFSGRFEITSVCIFLYVRLFVGIVGYVSRVCEYMRFNKSFLQSCCDRRHHFQRVFHTHIHLHVCVCVCVCVCVLCCANINNVCACCVRGYVTYVVCVCWWVI